jgi:hypothetical protein
VATQLPLIVEKLPPIETYWKAVAAISQNRANPEKCRRWLFSALHSGRLTKGDCQTIWRGTFRKWETPFDRV